MLPRVRTSVVLAAVAVGALVAAPAVVAAPAPVSPRWASPAAASVRPGTQTFTGGGQCTSNFVFTDARGDVYLGQAAHCAGTGASTDTDGCRSNSLPLGTPVRVSGAEHAATLTYSSWRTMKERGEEDGDACAFNDFALVRLDPRDRPNVNPTIPAIGGPTGLTESTSRGEPIRSFGNSGLRQGLKLLSRKDGVSLGTTNGGWTQQVYTATPGVPGDSGSAFIDESGRAFGVLSTLSILPLPASNGVTSLANALEYLHGNSSHPPVTLAVAAP